MRQERLESLAKLVVGAARVGADTDLRETLESLLTD